MKKAVTIKSIAEQLGLSRNTVAKALNGQYVPEKTRERVLKKAQEMNYKSLDLKRIEVGAAKYRILLVSGKPLNNISYFIPLIGGIESFCFQHNHELFQYIFNSSRMPFAALSGYIKELNADGIVAVECFDKSLILKLLNLGKPVVFNDFTHAEIVSDAKYDIISANDEQSIHRVVRLLRDEYRITRFTFVGDSKHCMSFHNRYMGMLLGLVSAKIAHSRTEDILCSDESFDYGSTDGMMSEILKLKYMPECFICGNDFIARTVCTALKLLGKHIPGDVLVVGFDNVADSYSLSPAISTFAVDKQFLGTETMRTLIHRIENSNIPPRNITVSAQFIRRQSTTR